MKDPRKIAFVKGTVVMLAAEPVLGQLTGQGGCSEALHSPGEGGQNQRAAQPREKLERKGIRGRDCRRSMEKAADAAH